MDGFRVAALADALPSADVVITATGLTNAVGAEAFAADPVRPGTLVADAAGADLADVDVAPGVDPTDANTAITSAARQQPSITAARRLGDRTMSRD